MKILYFSIVFTLSCLFVYPISFVSAQMPPNLSIPHTENTKNNQTILDVGHGGIQENLPMPQIGNRTLAISIQNHLAQNQTRLIQFRFFDNNTNKSIYHVTAFINITSSHSILLAELFHTHSGNLILKIESMHANETESTNTLGGYYSSARELIQYYNDRHQWLVVNATIEPILGGFESSNGSNTIIIHSNSFFNDNYTNYHIHVILYSMNNDDSVFSDRQAPKFDATVNSSSTSNTTLFYDDIHSNAFSSQNRQIQYISPLGQFESGIAAKDVKCKPDLQLVIKAEDGTPACVTPTTAKILIESGWAKEIVTNTS